MMIRTDKVIECRNCCLKWVQSGKISFLFGETQGGSNIPDCRLQKTYLRFILYNYLNMISQFSAIANRTNAIP